MPVYRVEIEVTHTHGLTVTVEASTRAVAEQAAKIEAEKSRSKLALELIEQGQTKVQAGGPVDEEPEFRTTGSGSRLTGLEKASATIGGVRTELDE